MPLALASGLEQYPPAIRRQAMLRDHRQKAEGNRVFEAMQRLQDRGRGGDGSPMRATERIARLEMTAPHLTPGRSSKR
jgi:hypothetical protein